MTTDSGRCPSGRAAAADAASSTVSSKAGIPNAVYAIAPKEWCSSYLTPGKAYLVEQEDGHGFVITNDTGTSSYCLWKLCGHLRPPSGPCGSWQRAASAIEAPSGGETAQTGSTEGESAVAESQTPNNSRTTP